MLDRTTTQIAAPKTETAVFEQLESNVRSYARSFNAVFSRANGTVLTDVHGNRYLDFLAGAGSLNYGHNNPVFKGALVDYIMDDGITHSLDLHTVAKERVPGGDAERHPQAARPRQLRHAVRRPDRHQRGRSRAEDRPQGHRPPERHLLHQRLPRRVDGRAGGDRQLATCAPPPACRSTTPPRCRSTAISARASTPSRTWRRCCRTLRRHGHPGRRDPRDRAGRGRPERRAHRLAQAAARRCATSAASC